jgi:tetratricopeptide (TPR) repeat protein
MSTQTPKLQPVVNEFSETERSDIARLLIHANDLYQMYNSSEIPSEKRKTSLGNAFKLITEVMNVAPNNAPAMNLLGRIELDRGNIKTAAALFDKCLSHSPDNTQYLCNKGYLHIITEEPELSIDYFNKALEIDKSYQNAFLGIARAQHALQNFDIAYLHYRSLINHGFDSTPILQGMLSCCAQIKIEQYQKALELDLFTLFAHPELPHERLGHFAASLISKKYDLENPKAMIDLQAVAEDPLVYFSLLKCTLPDPYVEEFITLLRQTILLEALESGNLRDELQVLSIAIGVYNERNNYSLITDTLEQEKVDYLDQLLIHTLHHEWNIDDIAGALLVVGMYQAFFSQNYAVKLTAIDLEDWPSALQPLMESALSADSIRG